MALFLTEQDVNELLTMDAAIEALEESFHHQAAGAASNSPRRRIRVGGGIFHFMAAADTELAVMGMKSYGALGAGGSRFYVHLNDSNTGELLAVIEAGRMGQIRHGSRQWGRCQAYGPQKRPDRGRHRRWLPGRDPARGRMPRPGHRLCPACTAARQRAAGTSPKRWPQDSASRWPPWIPPRSA